LLEPQRRQWLCAADVQRRRLQGPDHTRVPCGSGRLHARDVFRRGRLRPQRPVMRYPMIKPLMAIALCGLAASGWAQATSPVLHGAEPASVAVNDDDWRVEIVPPFALPSREPGYHGGAVVERPRAVLLFLGEGWAGA